MLQTQTTQLGGGASAGLIGPRSILGGTGEEDLSGVLHVDDDTILTIDDNGTGIDITQGN